jgi:hypothetical protein
MQPKGRTWGGRIVSGLTAVFLLMDAGMKLLKLPAAVDTTVQLGYPESAVAGIGVTLLISTILYVIPRTSILGAILLTGYLGGAVATNVRAVTPLFNVVFAIVFGILVWAGLVLRNKRLEGILLRP